MTVGFFLTVAQVVVGLAAAGLACNMLGAHRRERDRFAQKWSMTAADVIRLFRRLDLHKQWTSRAVAAALAGGGLIFAVAGFFQSGNSGLSGASVACLLFAGLSVGLDLLLLPQRFLFRTLLANLELEDGTSTPTVSFVFARVQSQFYAFPGWIVWLVRGVGLLLATVIMVMLAYLYVTTLRPYLATAFAWTMDFLARSS